MKVTIEIAPLVSHASTEDEGHYCMQCDEPLGEDRISPQDRAYDETLCEDCGLEYTNPREWARRNRASS